MTLQPLQLAVVNETETGEHPLLRPEKGLQNQLPQQPKPKGWILQGYLEEHLHTPVC